MFLRNKLDIYKIYLFLSDRRKKEVILLFFLILTSGFLEAFSVAAAIPFLALLSSPESIFDIYLIQKFANFFNINNPSELFLPATILFCVVILLSTSIRLLNLWFISFFTSKVEIDLSKKLFENNLYQSYSHYTQRNSSEIIALLNNKVQIYAASVNAFLRSATSTILATSIIFSLFLINLKVSLFILIAILGYYFLIAKKVKKILSINSNKEASLYVQAIRIVQEAFGAFRDLTINNTQEVYLKSYLIKQKKIQYILVLSQFLIQSPRFLLEAAALVTIIFSGYFLTISTNDLSFITLLGTYAFGAQKLIPIIQQIYGGWGGYKSKEANLKYILNELEKKSFTKNFKLERNINNNSFDTLVFKDIFYTYKTDKFPKYILKKVNIEIKKGDFVGIFGETGSGKSTFLDLLMGLLKANKGNIFFNNINLYEKQKINSWRNLIAHVPQDIFLKEGTIEENIVFDNGLQSVNFPLLIKAAKIAKIYNFIKNLDSQFNTKVGERGIRLSGGQKQRISIARAIYQKKKILVLDEATSALDEKTEKSVIEAIRKFDKEITLIMVSHRLKTLKNCNRILKVSDGSIIDISEDN